MATHTRAETGDGATPRWLPGVESLGRSWDCGQLSQADPRLACGEKLGEVVVATARETPAADLEAVEEGASGAASATLTHGSSSRPLQILGDSG